MTIEKALLQEMKEHGIQVEDLDLSDVDFDNMPDLIGMWKKLKKHPDMAGVYTTFKDGQVHILQATNGIKSITGYSIEELRDVPLRFIMPRDINVYKLKLMLESLDVYGISPKCNLNLCKDGTTVRTMGVVWKLKRNLFFEMVWKVSDIIDLT